MLFSNILLNWVCPMSYFYRFPNKLCVDDIYSMGYCAVKN